MIIQRLSMFSYDEWLEQREYSSKTRRKALKKKWEQINADKAAAEAAKQAKEQERALQRQKHEARQRIKESGQDFLAEKQRIKNQGVRLTNGKMRADRINRLSQEHQDILDRRSDIRSAINHATPDQKKIMDNPSNASVMNNNTGGNVSTTQTQVKGRSRKPIDLNNTSYRGTPIGGAKPNVLPTTTTVTTAPKGTVSGAAAAEAEGLLGRAKGYVMKHKLGVGLTTAGVATGIAAGAYYGHKLRKNKSNNLENNLEKAYSKMEDEDYIGREEARKSRVRNLPRRTAIGLGIGGAGVGFLGGLATGTPAGAVLGTAAGAATGAYFGHKLGKSDKIAVEQDADYNIKRYRGASKADRAYLRQKREKEEARAIQAEMIREQNRIQRRQARALEDLAYNSAYNR